MTTEEKKTYLHVRCPWKLPIRIVSVHGMVCCVTQSLGQAIVRLHRF